MKSIMDDKKRHECYLCRKLYMDDSQKVTEEHHAIHGNGRRQLSEKYGLKVYLCQAHHTGSNQAVHLNHEMDLMVEQDAQRAFEKDHSRSEFISIFGKSYL